MKLAAVLAASALVGTSLLSCQPAVASTSSSTVKTFSGAPGIYGISVTEAVNRAAGMKLLVDVQGVISETATSEDDGSISAAGTITVTSGTHTFTSNYTSSFGKRGAMVFPIDALKVGDPINVSVTAHKPDSSDEASLAVTGFDTVRLGVVSLSTTDKAFQERCISKHMTGGLETAMNVRSLGDKYPKLSATATFYSNGKQLFTKPVVLRQGGLQPTGISDETGGQDYYPQRDSVAKYVWNGTIGGKRQLGTYRWVLKVTDKSTGKVYTASHRPVHIVAKAATCAVSGRSA